MTNPIIRGNSNTTKLMNYLKNSPVQYPVLDKAAEREMIRKNAGNRDELNRLLFMHNMRMVFNMAKRYMSSSKDYDSLVQNGMLGLMRATKEFDPSKDIKFCTYATIWVKKFMTMTYYSTQYKVDSNTVSLNAPVSQADGAQADLSQDETVENFIHGCMDVSCLNEKSVVDEIAENEQNEICKGLYDRLEQDNTLSATDKAVFSDIFVRQEKTRDVAVKYGIKASDVSEIRRKVLAMMKDTLSTEFGVRSYSDIA